jgi:hypothetical protein
MSLPASSDRSGVPLLSKAPPAEPTPQELAEAVGITRTPFCLAALGEKIVRSDDS